MPSTRTLMSIAVYWALWLLVPFSVFGGRFRSGPGAAALWLIGATALAAWFTWVKLKDAAAQRSSGADDDGEDDDDDADASASPALRFLRAVVFGVGGMTCLFGAAMLPALRLQLALFGLLALAAAAYALFFGRRGRSDDVDYD